MKLYEQDTLRYHGVPYRYNLGHRYRVSTHSLPHPLECGSTLQVVSQSYSTRWAPTKTSVPPPASNQHGYRATSTLGAHHWSVTDTLYTGAMHHHVRKQPAPRSCRWVVVHHLVSLPCYAHATNISNDTLVVNQPLDGDTMHCPLHGNKSSPEIWSSPLSPDILICISSHRYIYHNRQSTISQFDVRQQDSFTKTCCKGRPSHSTCSSVQTGSQFDFRSSC